MAWATKQSTGTKHTCNDGFGPSFGKKTPGCPRCDELLNGATVRSWGNELKKQNDAQRSKEIKNHDCAKSHCFYTGTGYICTAFDY